LCVLYSKGQKAKPGQPGQRSTGKEPKEIAPISSLVCVLCLKVYVATELSGGQPRQGIYNIRLLADQLHLW
jgi:hypothetical protein